MPLKAVRELRKARRNAVLPVLSRLEEEVHAMVWPAGTGGRIREAACPSEPVTEVGDRGVDLVQSLTTVEGHRVRLNRTQPTR
jgi:hypothetical protein